MAALEQVEVPLVSEAERHEIQLSDSVITNLRGELLLAVTEGQFLWCYAPFSTIV